MVFVSDYCKKYPVCRDEMINYLVLFQPPMTTSYEKP